MPKLIDNELEEVLQHFGTQGMRWGVRKSIGQLKTLRRSKMNSAAKTVVGAAGAVKSRVKGELNSAKRERNWVKTARTSSTLSDKKIKSLVERIKLENDLKRLTKGDITLRKIPKRKEYINRDKIPTPALRKRVARLQLEANLGAHAKVARAGQKKLGEQVAKVAAARMIGGNGAAIKMIRDETINYGKKAANAAAFS